MRIGALGLGAVLGAMGLGGCGSVPIDGGGARLDLVCKAGQPCKVPVGATTNGFNSCKVSFPTQSTTTIATGVDVSWTLPWLLVGHFEFVGEPGIDITDPRPDFINGRYGADRGTYIWTGSADRTKVPRKYKFQVVWANAPFSDQPLPCGTIDPTIVNSL